jgi:hypothetical protein
MKKKFCLILPFALKYILIVLIILGLLDFSLAKFNIENFKEKKIDGFTSLDKNTKNGPIRSFRFTQSNEDKTSRFENLDNFVQKKVN